VPGFRPGKAPKDMILKNYSKQLDEEVRRRLINDNYEKALKEQKLHAVTSPDIEEIQFSRGQALQFAATVETAPEFELPAYKGLTVQREARAVTETDVESALQALREPRVGYKTADRPIQSGDVAVVNYTGTCEGKP